MSKKLPENLSLRLNQRQKLRYGENPHQEGAFYILSGAKSPWEEMAQLGGKELSYNNILDADAALGAVSDFPDPTCVIVKHTNPCGIASHEDIVEAYRLAFSSDPISTFGGIIAFNRLVNDATAKAIRMTKHPTSGAHLFVEIILAPDYAPDALDRLRKNENLRILKLPLLSGTQWTYRSVSGAILVQESDTLDESQAKWRVATKRVPTEQEWTDLRFAWKCVKHVRSNAIVLAKNRTLVGMGTGQPNRVNSVRLALAQAGEKAVGTVLASDAFFPFPDGVATSVAHGVQAFIQPGGSIRDIESVTVADAAGATMILTGIRHFKH